MNNAETLREERVAEGHPKGQTSPELKQKQRGWGKRKIGEQPLSDDCDVCDRAFSVYHWHYLSSCL